jgi:hypothetical protein
VFLNLRAIESYVMTMEVVNLRLVTGVWESFFVAFLLLFFRNTGGTKRALERFQCKSRYVVYLNLAEVHLEGMW